MMPEGLRGTPDEIQQARDRKVVHVTGLPVDDGLIVAPESLLDVSNLGRRAIDSQSRLEAHQARKKAKEEALVIESAYGEVAAVGAGIGTAVGIALAGAYSAISADQSPKNASIILGGTVVFSVISTLREEIRERRLSEDPSYVNRGVNPKEIPMIVTSKRPKGAISPWGEFFQRSDALVTSCLNEAGNIKIGEVKVPEYKWPKIEFPTISWRKPQINFSSHKLPLEMG